MCRSFLAHNGNVFPMRVDSILGMSVEMLNYAQSYVVLRLLLIHF